MSLGFLFLVLGRSDEHLGLLLKTGGSGVSFVFAGMHGVPPFEETLLVSRRTVIGDIVGYEDCLICN